MRRMTLWYDTLPYIYNDECSVPYIYIRPLQSRALLVFSPRAQRITTRGA